MEPIRCDVVGRRSVVEVDKIIVEDDQTYSLIMLLMKLGVITPFAFIDARPIEFSLGTDRYTMNNLCIVKPK